MPVVLKPIKVCLVLSLSIYLVVHVFKNRQCMRVFDEENNKKYCNSSKS